MTFSTVEMKFESILDNAPCGYISFDDNGKIQEVNNTLLELLGYKREQLLQQKFESILNIAGRIFFQTHFFPMLKMQLKAEEIYLTLAATDSSLLPVLTNAKREFENDQANNICVFIPVHNRKKFEDELIEAKRKAENALKENQELIIARQNADEQAKQLDRQLVKLNQVNNDLLQFNNIIHHDMQECIRKILLFSRMGENEKELNYFNKIKDNGSKLKHINESLNLFIRIGVNDQKYEILDLNKILEQARDKVLKAFRFTGLELISDKLPELEGVEEQLNLLFFHLLGNSIKFRNGKTVKVEISSVIFESNVFKTTPGKYHYTDVVRITIKDDGAGFDNQHKDYVFKMLKKIYAETAGTGIGLAICKKVVDNHNGDISIESEEGKGTAVTVILPLKH